MGILKGFAIGLGALVVLLLIVGGVAYYLLTRPTGIQTQLRTTEITTQAAQSFDQKVDAFEQALRQASQSGQKQEVALTLTEIEVNSKIAESLKDALGGGQLPENMDVGEVKVNFAADKILAGAQVTISGITTNVGVVAKADVVDGKPKITVQEIDVGKLPLPGAVKDRIEAAVLQGADINDLLKDLPLDLQSIVVKDGQIVLQGQAK